MFQDVFRNMDVGLIRLPFVSDGTAPLLVTPSLAPITHILQIYEQTDGSYMGSSEMSPLYSIVHALTQTATTIILTLTSLLPCGLVFPLPVCHLPRSLPTVSQHPTLFLSMQRPRAPPLLWISYITHHSPLAW